MFHVLSDDDNGTPIKGIGMLIAITLMQQVMNDQAERVASYGDDERGVRTYKVVDGEKPYEVLLRHPEYNDGSAFCVAAYDTEEEARKGHDEWVGKLVQGLPDAIPICANSTLHQLMLKRMPDNDALKFARRDQAQKHAA